MYLDCMLSKHMLRRERVEVCLDVVQGGRLIVRWRQAYILADVLFRLSCEESTGTGCLHLCVMLAAMGIPVSRLVCIGHASQNRANSKSIC